MQILYFSVSDFPIISDDTTVLSGNTFPPVARFPV